jgi:hypothetical protein
MVSPESFIKLTEAVILGFDQSVAGERVSRRIARSDDSPILAGLASRLAFKVIIEIIMAPASPGDRAREEINRDERSPPTLGLAHVNLFVIAARVETSRITTDNHMSQRHRLRPDDRRREKPARKSAVEFERSASHLRPASRQKRERSRDEPDERSRRRPQINQRANDPRRFRQRARSSIERSNAGLESLARVSFSRPNPAPRPHPLGEIATNRESAVARERRDQCDSAECANMLKRCVRRKLATQNLDRDVMSENRHVRPPKE